MECVLVFLASHTTTVYTENKDLVLIIIICSISMMCVAEFLYTP